MTVIVGCKDKNRIHIGADSAVTAGSTQSVLKQPKVFKKGKILMACCGLYRDIQLARVVFTPPEDTTDDAEEYLVTQFIPELKKVLEPKEEVCNEIPFGCIIGYKNRLFSIDEIFSVCEEDLVVDGIGGSIALGVMRSSKLKPKARVRLALETACEVDLFCKRPITIKSI